MGPGDRIGRVLHKQATDPIATASTKQLTSWKGNAAPTQPDQKPLPSESQAIPSAVMFGE